MGETQIKVSDSCLAVHILLTNMKTKETNRQHQKLIIAFPLKKVWSHGWWKYWYSDQRCTTSHNTVCVTVILGLSQRSYNRTLKVLHGSKSLLLIIHAINATCQCHAEEQLMTSAFLSTSTYDYNLHTPWCINGTKQLAYIFSPW